ncbi:MAG: hypothetical protein H0X46_08010, partial [Bacteroidetes bacterium]|nr:hypothetical protein [Bacteroidota bacterium]
MKKMNGLKQFIFIIYMIPIIGLSQNDSIYTKKVNKNEVVHQCFNKKTKKPMVIPDYSYGLYVSAIVSVTDNQGNSELSFRDTLGNPTHDTDSIYVYKMKLDHRGIYSETKYYYLNNIEAHAGDYWLHDKKGRELELGQIRMNDSAKINFWKTIYNKKGNILSEIYYKSRDSIGENSDRSIVQYYYDGHSNFTGYAYKDHNGKLTAWQDDYAMVVNSYNKRDQIVSAAWFDR